MAIYKKISLGNRGFRYMRDKKFISQKSIPANIFELLQKQDEVNDEGIKLQKNVRECLFCGQFAKYERFINLQTIALCEEHFYGKTIGQIAQQLNKEKEDAKSYAPQIS